MHIETSADARRSRRHAAGVDHVGHAADDRGYLAAAASRISLWWHGDRRPPALTADTASGAGLQGGIEDDVPPCDGEANPASPECGDPRTDSDLLGSNFNLLKEAEYPVYGLLASRWSIYGHSVTL